MNATVPLYRGDYLADMRLLGVTPLGKEVVSWKVIDLVGDDLETFAEGTAIGSELALVEAAQAARDRRAAA